MGFFRSLATLAVFAAGVAAAPSASAQTPRVEPVGLTGALARIAKAGAVTIGYREASPPFSFLDRAGRPIGYAIDICAAIVEDIGRTLGRDDLKIAFAKVTPADRFDAIRQGKIDLECGSTTANAERAKLVSFSPLTFVAGAKVMVAKDAPWRDFTSLKGKTVIATKGTTTVDAIKRLSEKFNLGVTLVEAADHEDGYRAFAEGKADALANDDVLLYGLIAQHKAADKYKVAGELLSYEPYAIGFAHRDAAMKEVIEKTFRRLVVGNEIEPTYNRWFLRPLPNGERFNMPMSPQLAESFRVLGAVREQDDAE